MLNVFTRWQHWTDNVHPRVKVRSLRFTACQWSLTRAGSRQWSNYGGARGGLAHLKDLAAPAKHLFWEGSRGPVKGPLKLQDDHPLFIDVLLQFQFASVFFCTEIAVEKHFDPLKCDFWRGLEGGPWLCNLSLWPWPREWSLALNA